MKSSLIRMGLLLLLGVACLALGFGQAPQTGSLTGTVVDDSGQPLPGVGITISSPQLIAPQMSVSTSSNGFFRFTYLPPGTYKAVATLDGFSTFIQTDIIVKAGLTTDLKMAMKPASIQETIEVVGAAPAAALENTKLTVLIESKDIARLPVQRNLQSVMALAPGVTSDNAALGGHQRSNAFNVDGVFLNDIRRGTQEVQGSLDAYDEVMIETAGHPAEYGQSTGAMLNVITKSGGNNFSGSASFFYSGRGLQDTNFENKGLTAPPYENVYNIESNLSLGGPIVKDKVWFFGSLSYLPTADRYESVLTDDVTKKMFLPSGKITAQLGNRNRLSLNLTTNSIRSPLAGAGIQEGGVIIRQDASVKWDIQSLTGLLTWIWQASDKSYLEVKVASSHSDDNIEANSHKPLYMDLATLEIYNGMSSYFNEKQRYIGSAHFTQFADFAGEHSFKAGFEAEQTKMSAQSVWYPDDAGMTSYYLLDGSPMMSVAANPAEGNVRLSNYTQLGFYLQDAWRVSPHLHFNLGLRVSYLHSRIPVQDYVDQTVSVAKWTDLEPRLGLAYDPFGDGKTAFRAGYNRYTAGTYMWFDSLNPNNSAEDYYLWFGGTDFSYLFTYEPGLGGIQTNISPDLRRPITDEFLLGFTRSVTNDFNVGVDFIYRKFRRFITTENNWTPDSWVPVTVDNPLGGTMTVYDLVPDLPTSTPMLTNNPRAYRNYTALLFTLEKKFRGGSLLRASYTWSRAFGRASMTGSSALSAQSESGAAWNDPNALINTEGLLDLNRTHNIKVQGIVNLPLRFFLSATYDGASGTPFQRDFVVSLPESGAKVFFAEPRGSQHYPFLHLLNIRIGKDISLGRTTLSLFADIFNPLNQDATTMSLNRLGSADFGKVLGIQPARYALLGARFSY